MSCRELSNSVHMIFFSLSPHLITYGKILERAGDICREQVKDLFRTESESDEEREGCHEQI